MQAKSATWRLRIWIACFAILMNALAPSISHALNALGSNPVTFEICSAAATPGQSDLVVIGAASARKAGPSKAGAMKDCGYCLPHAGSDALTPTAVTGLGIFGGHQLRPFLFYRAPQPLLALSAAAPRGPPALA